MTQAPDERAAQRPAPPAQPTLFLINPALKYKHYVVQKNLCRMMGKKNFSVPLALPLVAALTPANYRIRIIDEEMEPIPFDARPDIVGITAAIATIRRAYEIADRFRAAGSLVVFGGNYTTFMTDEGLEHADCVVIGEAEGAWEALLADYERGALKKVYKAAQPTAYRTSPIPRWDLVDTTQVMAVNVQFSRGCPYRCEFCLVQKVFGNRMRFRDIDDVIAEIASLPLKRFFFADDNFGADLAYTKALLEKLKPLNTIWLCQATVDIARDEELLREMAAAGCWTILIGFESMNPDSLREAHKHHNKLADYEQAIARIHAVGIHVTASFIVGFDADGPEAFDRIFEFSVKNNLPFTLVCPLSAAPGTELWEKMKKDDRLLDLEPEFYSGSFPCIRHNHMSAVEVFDRHLETITKLTSFDVLHAKALHLFGAGKFTGSEGTDITFGQKFFGSMKLVNKLLLTRDRTKRRLFLDLFAMGRSGKASMDKIAAFLLHIVAMHEYLEESAAYLRGIREKIAKIDPGPWNDGA
jgi:radical SAM superfamily enzyme YgiQ (UPF0313 family)